MEKRKKIGLLFLAVIGITVALIWGVRIQEMKNENTENLANEEKNDDLKGDDNCICNSSGRSDRKSNADCHARYSRKIWGNRH